MEQAKHLIFYFLNFLNKEHTKITIYYIENKQIIINVDFLSYLTINFAFERK